MAVIVQDKEVFNGLQVAQVVGKDQSPVCVLVVRASSEVVPVTSRYPRR